MNIKEVCRCKMCDRFTLNIVTNICDWCSEAAKKLIVKKCKKCGYTGTTFKKALSRGNIINYYDPNFVVKTNSISNESHWDTQYDVLDVCVTCFSKLHSEKYKCARCKKTEFKYHSHIVSDDMKPFPKYRHDENGKIYCIECLHMKENEEIRKEEERYRMTALDWFVVDHM